MVIKMRKSISIVLILAAFLVVGCLESGIQGKYIDTEEPNQYMELNSDGTFFVYQDSGSFSGTYEVKDDTIRLILPNGMTVVGKIEGNNLIDPEGVTWKKV